MNLCVKTKVFRPQLIGSICRFATTSPESLEQNEQVLIDDSDEALAREAEIEKKRNISRLSAGHFNQINGRRPYELPQHLAHLTVKYNRKLYGKYGSASGVNPSMLFVFLFYIKLAPQKRFTLRISLITLYYFQAYVGPQRRKFKRSWNMSPWHSLSQSKR